MREKKQKDTLAQDAEGGAPSWHARTLSAEEEDDDEQEENQPSTTRRLVPNSDGSCAQWPHRLSSTSTCFKKGYLNLVKSKYILEY